MKTNDGTLYEVCAARKSELTECMNGEAFSRIILKGSDSKGRPTWLRLFYVDKYDKYFVYAYSNPVYPVRPKWTAFSDSAARRINLKDNAWKDKLGVPLWLVDALRCAVLVPPEHRVYRYDDQSGASGFVVGTLPDGDFAVLPMAGVREQSLPADLEDLSIERFWKLMASGRLTATRENLVGAGWIWHRGAAGNALTLLPDAHCRFTGPGVREPLNLSQIDEFSCYPNTIAALLWMFGVSDLQGDEAIRAVDEFIGREPGELPWNSMELGTYMLLRKGFSFVHYSTWDGKRLVAEGAKYLEEQEGSRWTPELRKYFTKKRIADAVKRDAEMDRRADELYAPFKHAIRTIRKKPRLRDVKRLLRDGYVVRAELTSDLVYASHAVLVFAQDANGFVVYSPSNGERTFRYYTHQQFGAKWKQNRLAAIKR